MERKPWPDAYELIRREARLEALEEAARVVEVQCQSLTGDAIAAAIRALGKPSRRRPSGPSIRSHEWK